MKKESKEFLLQLINRELAEEYEHKEHNENLLGGIDEITSNYIRDLLKVKIDLLSNAQGLDALVNKYDIEEDLKKFGYTTKDLK